MREVLYLPEDRRSSVPWEAQGTTKKMNAEIERGMDVYNKMVDKNVSGFQDTVRFNGLKKGEGYFSGSDRSYHLDGQGIFLSKSANATTVMHELGHHLETSNINVLERAADFVTRRTRGEVPQPMREVTRNNNYRSDEFTRPDKFLNAYMGKVYQAAAGWIMATEITSMGLELFFSDPLKLARQDPDYFDEIFAILRGLGRI